jgi:hypothetical protein
VSRAVGRSSMLKRRCEGSMAFRTGARTGSKEALSKAPLAEGRDAGRGILNELERSRAPLSERACLDVRR